MTLPLKIRAVNKDGITNVKVLMKHDMETGNRRGADTKIIPAWHITEVKIQHNDKDIFFGEFGPGISKDPFLNIKFKGGAKGDKVTVSWIDNKGKSRSDSTKIR